VQAHTLVEKPGGKKLLERPDRIWEDNIKEIVYDGVKWIRLVQNRSQ
jgi:hypothetical protein